jgi:hypothetical protein
MSTVHNGLRIAISEERLLDADLPMVEGWRFDRRSMPEPSEWTPNALELFGFGELLISSWPTGYWTKPTKSGRPTSQDSQEFAVAWRGIFVFTLLEQKGLAQDHAITLLRALERLGLFWIVNRGEEILYLEPRP